MNWFQRAVSRVVLGRERLYALDSYEKFSKSWVHPLEFRYPMKNPCRDPEEEAIAKRARGNRLRQVMEDEAGESDSAPASVHFRPTMSVDDMPEPQWPITSHVWSRLVPVSSDCFPWERDSLQVRSGPKAKCYEVKADGSMREVPEAEVQAHFHAHVCRPRVDSTDPRPVVGDMPPHMPYDFP